MGTTETATVSLNLDAPFESEAARANAAGKQLISTLEGIAAASQKAAAVDLGIKTDSAAFSNSSAFDFKRSKWETPLGKGSPEQAKRAGAKDGEAYAAARAAAQGKDGAGGAAGAPKDLKYLLKQAGIGRAALGAVGTAAALEMTKLALGYRGMAQLQALTTKAGFQIRQLFRGVDPSPVVRATDRFFQLFNQATPAGKALASMFDHAFNGLFRLVERVEPELSKMAKGGIIVALKLEQSWYELQLAALPLTAAIGDISDALGGLDWDTEGMMGWKSTVDEIAGITKAAASAIRTMAETLRDFNIGGKEQLAINAKRNLGMVSEGEYERQRRENLQGPTWNPKGGGTEFAPVGAGFDAGTAFGTGQAKGMRAKIPDVTAAGVELGAAGAQGVRTGADAHSPSRKTEKTGRDMGAGVVVGMDATAPDVQASAERSLVPRLPLGAPAGAASSGPSAARIVIELHHHWPAGVDSAKRAAIEDAGEAGTWRALRTIAAQKGIPLEIAS